MIKNGVREFFCIDDAHSLTSYKFFVINLIVPDEYGHGYPVAHFITNKQSGLVFKTIMKSIKDRSEKENIP